MFVIQRFNSSESTNAVLNGQRQLFLSVGDNYFFPVAWANSFICLLLTVSWIALHLVERSLGRASAKDAVEPNGEVGFMVDLFPAPTPCPAPSGHGRFRR